MNEKEYAQLRKVQCLAGSAKKMLMSQEEKIVVSLPDELISFFKHESSLGEDDFNKYFSEVVLKLIVLGLETARYYMMDFDELKEMDLEDRLKDV